MRPARLNHPRQRDVREAGLTESVFAEPAVLRRHVGDGEVLEELKPATFKFEREGSRIETREKRLPERGHSPFHFAKGRRLSMERSLIEVGEHQFACHGRA